MLDFLALSRLLDDQHVFSHADKYFVADLEACRLQFILVEVEVGVVVVPFLVFLACRTQLFSPYHSVTFLLIPQLIKTHATSSMFFICYEKILDFISIRFIKLIESMLYGERKMDYYDGILVGIFLLLTGSFTASILTPLSLNFTAAAGALFSSALMYQAMFKNPPVE